jgi:hypothetical protein
MLAKSNEGAILPVRIQGHGTRGNTVVYDVVWRELGHKKKKGGEDEETIYSVSEREREELFREYAQDAKLDKDDLDRLFWRPLHSAYLDKLVELFVLDVGVPGNAVEYEPDKLPRDLLEQVYTRLARRYDERIGLLLDASEKNTQRISALEDLCLSQKRANEDLNGRLNKAEKRLCLGGKSPRATPAYAGKRPM